MEFHVAVYNYDIKGELEVLQVSYGVPCGY
jgi:hypothetical protein